MLSNDSLEKAELLTLSWEWGGLPSLGNTAFANPMVEKLKVMGDVPGGPVVETALPSGCTSLSPGTRIPQAKGTAKRFKKRKKTKIKGHALHYFSLPLPSNRSRSSVFEFCGSPFLEPLWGLSGDFLREGGRLAFLSSPHLSTSSPYILTIFLASDSQKFGLWMLHLLVF